ncbi:MAG TPA: LuxR C-terminal-related transcriptional regulator [Acidimicrobiia bacterium]|nr:LuxR C-terminal-related transcriptional regulator [Acidimicrobiia bacterium]
MGPPTRTLESDPSPPSSLAVFPDTPPVVMLPVAVSDPVPSYRQGIVAAFERSGFDIEVTDDPERWAAEGGRRVLVMTVRPDEDLTIVRRLVLVNPEVLIVVLVQGAGAELYRAAFRAGAVGALAWDDPPDAVLAAVQVAAQGLCLLRHSVVEALATSAPPPDQRQTLSPWEIKWLQMLADGKTVAEVGREVGYSEREMFRLLQRLYTRMGARGRIDAIVKAAQAGLLG